MRKLDGRMVDSAAASVAALKALLNVDDTRFAAIEAAMAAHAALTNNPHAVTKTQLGLGNVENTTDANKPISTATQAALNLKANQSTTYSKTETDDRIQAIVGAAPGALDTLVEIAAQLAADESAVAALTTTVGTKLAKSGNLIGLTDVAAARTNLGLGSAALASTSDFLPASFSVDVPTAGTTTPIVDGTASVGTSPHFAHEDHVHPTDTSRAATVHTHTQGDISGLVTDLAGKAPTSHTHTTAQVTGLDTALNARLTGLHVRGPTTTTGGPLTAYGASYTAPASFAISSATVDAVSSGTQRITFDIQPFAPPGGGGGGGVCFPAGSMVMMVDGSTRPIESIASGDVLWSPSGPATVEHLHVTTLGHRKYWRMADNSLYLSDEHPLVVARGIDCRLWSMNIDMLMREAEDGIIPGIEDWDWIYEGEPGRVELFYTTEGLKSSHLVRSRTGAHSQLPLFMPFMTNNELIAVNGYVVGGNLGPGCDYKAILSGIFG